MTVNRILTGYEKRMQRRQAARINMQRTDLIPKAPRGGNGLTPDKTREELFCHNCDRYVQFIIDRSLNGRHVFNCPNCGHEHYRIVRDGEITAERWGQDPNQSNSCMPTISATTISYTQTSVWSSSSSQTTSDIGAFYDVTISVA